MSKELETELLTSIRAEHEAEEKMEVALAAYNAAQAEHANIISARRRSEIFLREADRLEKESVTPAEEIQV